MRVRIFVTRCSSLCSSNAGAANLVCTSKSLRRGFDMFFAEQSLSFGGVSRLGHRRFSVGTPEMH